jgi:NAD(P)-dependent dehydrogenase (short-subunit alcohol dehydrogenase family)
MDLQLDGKRALVTGASKGIGRAAAESLAAEGCSLVLVARTRVDLEVTRESFSARYGVPVEVRACDLSRSEAVDRLTADVGAVDVLVNNAGAIPPGDIEQVDEETWRASWDLKVFGYVNLTRRIYPLMREAGGGVIINVIGAAGERPTPGYIAGSAGNASLMALTRALGGVSRRDGIRVVAINPGLIETERLAVMTRQRAERKLGDPERWRELLDPVYPPGLPEHIGDLVAFLASPRSANTTGTVVTVDGGSSAR